MPCEEPHKPISSERNPEMSWMNPTHCVTENTHIKTSRKSWDTLVINPIPVTMPHCQEEPPTPSFFLHSERFKPQSLAPQLLRLPPKGQACKLPSSECKWGLHAQVPQDYSKTKQQQQQNSCKRAQRKWPSPNLSLGGAWLLISQANTWEYHR